MSFIAYSIYYHKKTNSYIKCGEICASKIDVGIFDRLRSEGKKLNRAGKNKAKILLAENGIDVESLEIKINRAENVLLAKKPIELIESVCETIRKSGKISSKQVDFLKNLINQIDVAAKKEEELKEKSIDIPEWVGGRQKVELVILKISHDYGYGSVEKNIYKIFGKTDQGQTVLFNCPKANEDDIENYKNKKIEITLTIDPKPDRISGKLIFAIGKRPSNLCLIAE